MMLDRVLSRRNTFPRWVNRAIDRLADRPMSLFGRLAALRLGRPAKNDSTRVLAPDADKSITVLIGPVNYAGQGHLWARSLARADGEIQAVNLALDVPGGFGFEADAVVPVPVYHNGRDWQKRQHEAATSFSHVLIEAEEPLFGRLFGRDVGAEIRDLHARGVSLALMAHGTDARLPSVHRTRTPWSPYLDPDFYTDRLETLARRNLALLTESGHPCFVSTPDLLLDVPGASWCPVVVDPLRWVTPEREIPAGPLKVVHVPSSAFIKGTQLIEPTLRSLHDSGIIDYRPISGVPSHRMVDVFADADVVLDQFRLGAYGVAACEAMAAGKLVLGHILPSVRELVREATGMELPILEATPDTLEERLLWIAHNRAEFATRRRHGMDFVSHVHDGRFSSKVLLENWIGQDPRNRSVTRK